MAAWRKLLLAGVIGVASFSYFASAAIIQEGSSPQSFCRNCPLFEPIGTTVKCYVIERKLVEVEVRCEYSYACAPWPFGPPGLETRKIYKYFIIKQCQEYLCFACVGVGPFKGCVWCPLSIGDPMYKYEVDYRVVRLGCGCSSEEPIPVIKEREEK